MTRPVLLIFFSVSAALILVAIAQQSWIALACGVAISVAVLASQWWRGQRLERERSEAQPRSDRRHSRTLAWRSALSHWRA